MAATGDDPRARLRAKDRSALLWHTGFFIVVNAFLWIQDMLLGGGVDYAYWTTIPWGFGLTLHALAYHFARRGLREPAGDQALVDEQWRETLVR